MRIGKGKKGKTSSMAKRRKTVLLPIDTETAQGPAGKEKEVLRLLQKGGFRRVEGGTARAKTQRSERGSGNQRFESAIRKTPRHRLLKGNRLVGRGS